jgi:hypothetical protein
MNNGELMLPIKQDMPNRTFPLAQRLLKVVNAALRRQGGRTPNAVREMLEVGRQRTIEAHSTNRRYFQVWDRCLASMLSLLRSHASVQVDGGELVLSALDKAGGAAQPCRVSQSRGDADAAAWTCCLKCTRAPGSRLASRARAARAGDVPTSLCAVLIAAACNTGFEPLIC